MRASLLELVDLWIATPPPGRARDVAWSLCRSVLSQQLGRADFALERSARGKPFVVGERLWFSLSHADGLVACCVSRSRQVGVDVEPLAHGPRVLRMGRDVLTERETARLGAAAGERAAMLWTLKEAYVKAYGTTIGDVDPGVLGFELVRGRARLETGGVGPVTARVLLAEGHAVSVAARGRRPFDLRVHQVDVNDVRHSNAAPIDRRVCP